MWFYLVTLAHRDKLHQHDRTKFIGWLGFYGLLFHRESNFQSVEEIVIENHLSKQGQLSLVKGIILVGSSNFCKKSHSVNFFMNLTNFEFYRSLSEFMIDQKVNKRKDFGNNYTYIHAKNGSKI